MDDQISYRALQDQDWDGITSILNKHISEGQCTLWQGPRTVAQMKEMYQDLGDREGLYVLLMASKIIGYGVIVKYHQKEGYRTTCETSVFLDPKQIGKGYGSHFKRFILSECKRKGYHHVVAKIFASNQRSISYNKKLGYKIVGTQKEIGISHGKFVDIVIMQYVFPMDEHAVG